MATLIHSPQTPPIPSTAVEDTRDYQTLAQVQTQIITSQNGAGHRVLGGTANDVLIVTAGGGISSTAAPSLTGPLQVGDGTGVVPAYAFSAQAGTGMYRPGSAQLGWALNGSTRMSLTTTVLEVQASGSYAWSSSGDASPGTSDTTIQRVSAKVIQMGNGDATGQLNLLTVQLGTQAVAGLPAAAAGNQGQHRVVTDSNATLTAGIGAVVAGGGASIVPVFSDGTNWRIG